MDPVEEVSYYTTLLKSAVSYAEKYYIKRADRMVRLYELEHYRNEDGTGNRDSKRDYERVKVPYPYANARQILAEILPADPEPIVKVEQTTLSPEDYATPELAQMGQMNPPDPIKGAQVLKQAIEYVIRKSNLKREAKMTTLDSIVTGIGILQLVAQKSSKIPKFRRVLYRDIYWQCNDVTDPYESAIIWVKIVRPMKDIKKDKDYDSANRQNVAVATLDPAEVDPNYSPETYGVLWEVFDKKNDVYMIIPDGQKVTLVRKKLSEMYKFKIVSDDFVVDAPFIFIVNEEMITKSWGLGDIYPIESMVRELDKVRTQQVNHRKRFNRKYLVKKKFLDAESVNQLKNPDDGTIVETNSDILPSNFHVIQDAPLSVDVYKAEDAARRDIQITSPIGPDSLVRGIGQAPETLGQSEIIEQNSNNRLGEKQKNIAAFYTRIFRLIGQYIQQYWTEEDVLRVAGDGTKPADWLKFSPLQVQGEYEYDVAVESLKDNTQAYRQELGQALTTMAPIMPILSQSVGMSIIAKRYLETFQTLSKDIDEIIPDSLTHPQPAPQQPGMPVQAGLGGPQGPLGLSGSSPQELLLHELQNEDPRVFFDKLNSLPDNEKQLIIQTLLPPGTIQTASPNPAPL